MAKKRVVDIRDPELSDEQWKLLAPHLPEPTPSPHGGPKPIANRPVVEGILWVLRNGGRWKALPREYPSPSTCWRRLEEFEESGAWLAAWRAFLDTLEAERRLVWDECFADGSFAPAKKGGLESALPNAAKVRSGWWWSMVKEFRWHVTSTRRTKRK